MSKEVEQAGRARNKEQGASSDLEEAQDPARGGNVVARLAALDPLALPTLPPSSKWSGEAVNGAIPINTSIKKLTLRAKRDGFDTFWSCLVALGWESSGLPFPQGMWYAATCTSTGVQLAGI